MANSPFLISDSGSTGSGLNRQDPIVISSGTPYTATIGTVPSTQVVWFKVLLGAGNWKFGGATEGTELFAAVFNNAGKLMYRGRGFAERVLTDGVYLIAISNKYSSAEDNFVVTAGTYGNLIPPTTNIQLALSSTPAKEITPEWVKSRDTFKRAIWCPTPKENQVPASIAIVSEYGVATPSLSLESGGLSRVFGGLEQTYYIGPGPGVRRFFVEDDEGESGQYTTESWPLGARYRPSGAGFFSNTFSESASIKLNLNRIAKFGIKAVVGFSLRRPFGSLTEAEASNSIKVELLNNLGQVVVTANGGVGLEAFIKGSPNKVYSAVAVGNNYQESDKFSAPAFRALAIMIAPDGRVAVGTHHPDFITEIQDFKIYDNYTCHHGGYPEIGTLTAEDMAITAIRVTVSKTCGMTYADIHLPNADLPGITEGNYWKDKQFVREDDFSLTRLLLKTDWDRAPF